MFDVDVDSLLVTFDGVIVRALAPLSASDEDARQFVCGPSVG